MEEFRRRTQYLVKKPFQLRYIAFILTIMLISALISGYTIYYNSWLLLGDKLAKVYPQGRLVDIFKTLNIKLGINLMFVVVICAGIGLIASHRIVGPINRIIRFIDNTTIHGDYKQRLSLRKDDELVDLAEAINRLLEKLDREKNT